MTHKIFHRLIGFWLLLIVAACTDEHLPASEGGRIVLNFTSGMSVSRTADTEIESALSHLDVFIWKLDGANNVPNTCVYYERIQGPLASPTGSVTLQAQKDDFEEGAGYRVDVIANATATEETFRAYTGWTQLQQAVQEDLRIQISGGHELGAVGTTIQNVPSHFLMDGIATTTANSNSAVLNSENSDDTQLSVILNRAAAKIEVRLEHGSNITFDHSVEAQQAMGYYLRNLCYSTNLLADENATHSRLLRKTDLFADAANVFFHWTESQVTITAYTYSHKWDQTEFFDKGTRMIVNLPVKYKAPGETEWVEYPNSFYQILLTKNNRFERNAHYIVEATIDAPGAVDHSEPVELTDLCYLTKAWTLYEMEIGGNNNTKFLSVNKDTLDMHSIVKDSTSLSFVSSSEVKVAVEEAYYYDEFGQKTNVDATTYHISAVPDGGLSGYITVKSDVPENNAIRYIKLKVDNNDESASEYVLVRQYPLEYITNIQGWYSYRSDFGGTTYESYGTGGIVATNGWKEEDKTWKYATDGGSNSQYLFTSKYVSQTNSNGRSTISYYKWERRGGWNPYYTVANDGSISGLNNARMYHVRITSTSNTYKVGIPKQEDGYTDTSTENSLLVSPSFMIASQLGATYSPQSVNQAASHCANYVEVYKDENGNKVELTNWRLPTEAEVKIIMKFQYVEDAAMDEVLSGRYYWSATGVVENTKSEDKDNNNAVRCIRDAY